MLGPVCISLTTCASAAATAQRGHKPTVPLNGRAVGRMRLLGRTFTEGFPSEGHTPSFQFYSLVTSIFVQ